MSGERNKTSSHALHAIRVCLPSQSKRKEKKREERKFSLVRVNSTYYVRKGSWGLNLNFPQINEVRRSDHMRCFCEIYSQGGQLFCLLTLFAALFLCVAFSSVFFSDSLSALALVRGERSDSSASADTLLYWYCCFLYKDKIMNKICSPWNCTFHFKMDCLACLQSIQAARTGGWERFTSTTRSTLRKYSRLWKSEFLLNSWSHICGVESYTLYLGRPDFLHQRNLAKKVECTLQSRLFSASLAVA